MDWYASFLSVNQPQSDVKFFGHDFFSVAIRPHDDEKKLQRKLNIDCCTARNCFPCYFHNHWTLTTFEASTARSPRLCFIDSLDIFEEEITQKFEDLFGLNSSFNTKVNLCHLNGGLQSEDPLSECGIFTMQNMEAFMKSEPFFKIARCTTVGICRATAHFHRVQSFSKRVRCASARTLRSLFAAGSSCFIRP